MAAKRINPEAYNALVDALASIYYNKRPFARFLQSHLRGQPDLLAGLSITGSEATKREVADEIVARLSDGEDRYQAVSLDLMVAVAEVSDFGNLRQQDDSERLVGSAKEAQARLKVWVEAYSDLRAARERLATEIASRAEGEAKRRSWDGKHGELLTKLMELYRLKDHQKRGILLEGLLNELFSLYDLSHRAGPSGSRTNRLTGRSHTTLMTTFSRRSGSRNRPSLRTCTSSRVRWMLDRKM